MSTPKDRPGAVRKNKKGPTKGSGGKGRKSLEGRGPTPKAEDRPYHKAYRSKQLAERSQAKRPTTRRPRVNAEMVTGRNSVVEALRAGIPAKALHIAVRIDVDDRVRESLKLAAEQGIPVMEASRVELDRMTDDAIHQGLALQVPPYEYQDAVELTTKVARDYEKGYERNLPLFLALDGITDPATWVPSSVRPRPSAPRLSLFPNAAAWASPLRPGRPAPAPPYACPSPRPAT